MSTAKNILNSMRIDERAAGSVGEKTLPSTRRYPSREIQPYIRTMPLAWVQRASPLKGKALAVGVAIWYAAGRRKSLSIKLRSSLLRDFGIHRHSGYRALQELEKAGLVKAKRQRGMCPVVDIITPIIDAMGAP